MEYIILPNKLQVFFHILAGNKKDGTIKVQPGANYTYRVEVYDFHGNRVDLIIPIEFFNTQATIKNTIKKTPYYVKAKNESIFEKNNVSVQIPENAFYNNFYGKIKSYNQNI